MSIKTIFLDRDGVINHEVNYLHKISEFKFINGIFESCLNFQKLGYQIIIVTNQSGIARGYYKESDYEKLTQWMLGQFNKHNVNILNVFHCPHGPESSCDCRKPKPGMLLKAKNQYNIDMGKSWMIGDSEVDISAAASCGIENTILVRSGHKIDESITKAKFILDSIKKSKKIIT
ncbi:D-glycero-beta-D-manno-heptose 1,7-bisphosphate 7-phosphatase [Candidatus Pseudothioglobus singularis]|nr:D-glycero-beta-D-manno-heptose 1,7-bisphosphate 7-phosphatase [Candidatus Pseudothioglobus singularis]